MTPSLSEELTLQQVKMRKSAAGFSLIELMVVVGIITILGSVALIDRSQLVPEKRLDAAAEQIRSVMVAARLYALSTGIKQYVVIDTFTESFSSTIDRDAIYAGAHWLIGVNWNKLEEVDLRNSNSKGEAVMGTRYESFSFSSRGTALGNSFLIRGWGVEAAGKGRVIIVNGVTGRVRIENCVDLGTCQ